MKTIKNEKEKWNGNDESSDGEKERMLNMNESNIKGRIEDEKDLA
jgi:hypothetical protein